MIWWRKYFIWTSIRILKIVISFRLIRTRINIVKNAVRVQLLGSRRDVAVEIGPAVLTENRIAKQVARGAVIGPQFVDLVSNVPGGDTVLVDIPQLQVQIERIELVLSGVGHLHVLMGPLLHPNPHFEAIGFVLFIGMFAAAIAPLRVMPTLQKKFWIIMLLTLFVGLLPRTWDYRKPVWFFLGIMASQTLVVRLPTSGTRRRSTSEASGIERDRHQLSGYSIM